MKKMKWALLSCGLFLTTFPVWGNALASVKSDNVPHRKIYAYFLGSNDFGSMHGLGYFYSDSPSKTELWVPFVGEYSVYTGAAANGVYYGLTYLYVNGTTAPEPQDVIAIEMQNGEARMLGPWSPREAMTVQDMTYSYADSTMYAISYGYEYAEDEEGNIGTYLATSLYTLDLEGKPLEKILICDTSMAYGAIAAAYDGSLYLMGRDGVLYSLDKSDGSVTALCKTEYSGPIRPGAWKWIIRMEAFIWPFVLNLTIMGMRII